MPLLKMHGGGKGDHGCVVRAEGGLCEAELKAGFLTCGAHACAEAAVATDAATDGEEWETALAGGSQRFRNEDVNYGVLEGGAEVVEGLLIGGIDFREEVADGGFESAEFGTALAGARYGDCCCIR